MMMMIKKYLSWKRGHQAGCRLVKLGLGNLGLGRGLSRVFGLRGFRGHDDGSGGGAAGGGFTVAGRGVVVRIRELAAGEQHGL